jgi:ankyrin repeat protein
MIEDIETMRNAELASVAYFYFDFRDIYKQGRRDMISSLLFQLSAQSIHYHDILHRLYLAHYSGTQAPSDGVLTECLKDMLLIPNGVPVYIFMDAIDECPNISGVPSPREEILGLVEELVNLRLPDLRLCVTSRPEIDICVALEPLSSFQLSLHDESGQKEDIADYIRSFVHSDRIMRRWRKEDKELVNQVLTERADGGSESHCALSYLLLTCVLFSFRWVFCQLESLHRCLPSSVRPVLDELPEALDETYERILMEIKLPNRNQARRLFQCLAVAIRPLRVEELAEVLAFDFDTEGATPKLNLNWRWEDREQAVLSACSSLVTIVDVAGYKVVKFSHFSVKEFLTSDRLATSSGRVSFYYISPEPAHTILAQACLSALVLLDDHFDLGQFPLAEYAAQHWVEHARFENVTSYIQGMELLFDPEKPHFMNWLSIHDMDEPPGSLTPPHPTRPDTAPLYYAALCGFYSLVEWLIYTRHVDVNSRGGHHERAIQAALYKGHLSIVSLLIDCGADINSWDVEGSSLLHVAAQTRDPEAVSLLLSRGADVQATDSSHWPVLFTALNEGNPDVVQLLIEHGADVHVRDGDGSTALHIGSGNEDLDVVRFLLHGGAEVDPQDNHGFTPLHLASAKGNDTIARLLIEHGANVDSLDNTNSTPLHLASTHGNSDVVVLLIEHGAYVGACDSKNSTPLHLASAKGNNTIARLLMRYGADASALDNTNSTPLHLASMRGNSDVVVLLIEQGAYVGACDSWNSTPLHLASTKGNRSVVRLLIDHGADMNVPGEMGNTPLHVASRHGPSDVVKLLLERGAEPNAQNDEGRTPLHIASQEGAVDLVQCLLTGGANVNVRNHNGETPQDVASNNPEVVQLLTGRARRNKRRGSRSRILFRQIPPGT